MSPRPYFVLPASDRGEVWPTIRAQGENGLRTIPAPLAYASPDLLKACELALAHIGRSRRRTRPAYVPAAVHALVNAIAKASWT